MSFHSCGRLYTSFLASSFLQTNKNFQFIYRLTTCPELSLGLFSSTTITPTTENQASHDAARAPDSHTPSHRAVLLAQVVATLTTAPTITDASMAIPTNLPAHSDHVAGGSSPSQTYSNQAPHSSSHPCSSHAPSKLLSYLTNALAALDVPAPERLNGETSQSPSDVDASVGQVDGDPSKITALRKQYLRKINRIAAAKKLRPPPYQELDPMPGHHPQGRTLAIHSVCVLPGYQHLGLGKILVKAYLQRMETSGIADRIVLLARPDLVGWYTGSFGFQDKGDSEAKFGGGGWRDMVSAFSASWAHVVLGLSNPQIYREILGGSIHWGMFLTFSFSTGLQRCLPWGWMRDWVILIRLMTTEYGRSQL